MTVETSMDLARLAEECRVRAELSQSPAQKQWWFEMAADWAAMANLRRLQEANARDGEQQAAVAAG